MKWTPWERATHFRDKNGKQRPVPDGLHVLTNNIYQVIISGLEAREPFGRIIWLSIKRRDRRCIHDWRDMQRIKNELVGREIEAVEIYPAESRLVDTANQYHLWCLLGNGFPDEHYQLPFGYADRRVSNGEGLEAACGAKQRPFAPDQKPDDCKTAAELLALPYGRLV